MLARIARPRSYSISGFNFQQDLLPLSTSLADTEVMIEDGEKHLSLVSAIALIVGLQVRDWRSRQQRGLILGRLALVSCQSFSLIPGV